MSLVARKPGYRGEVLFVNRDATNVLRRDQVEAFAVNSHIASTYRHWFRNGRIGQVLSTENALRVTNADEVARNCEKYKDDASGHYLASPYEKPGLKQDTKSLRKVAVRRGTGFHTLLRSSESSKSSRHIPQKRLERNIVPQKRPRSIPSPQALIDSGNSDPFSAAATPMTPFHIELINNWQHRYFY